MKPIDRLLFAQGGLCFFCARPLPTADASVEHLVARANGGGNDADNCVACCKTLNALFGRMSLKEKLRVILNQQGPFRCPAAATTAARAGAGNGATTVTGAERVKLVVADLRRRGPALPGTLTKLEGTISALFQKRLSGDEIESLIGQLRAEGVVSVSGAKLSYSIPRDD